MAAVLRRPTTEENASFKARVRYVLDVTGRAPNWYEERSNGALKRGEVWRWAYHPKRGANAGTLKMQAAAVAFGVDFEWLSTGASKDGRIFLDDPVMLPSAIDRHFEQRVARLIEERLQRDAAPSSKPRLSLIPQKKVARHGRKRPR